MKERIIIVFIAIIVGLIITTVGFFIYHSTQVIPKDTNNSTSASVTPYPQNSNKTFLTVDEPTNESLSATRTIVVKGKTNPGNTIIVSTNQDNEVAAPTSLGDFSVTVTIDAGANKIVTRALTPGGDESTDIRLITYSTEDF